MKKEYDLSKAKFSKGPLLDPKKTKVQTTVRLDADIFMWLQKLSKDESLPYQTLLNQKLKALMNADQKEESDLREHVKRLEQRMQRIERSARASPRLKKHG